MNLKELSKILGLSQTTVSRALNGFPEVSEATRARVKAAAEQHDYRPSQRARRLAKGRAFAIGHVMSRAERGEIVNPVFSDFLAGAADVYAAQGYEIHLSVLPGETDLEVYRALARAGAVDGIVVQAPRISDPRITMLQQIGLPFVVHGRSSEQTTPYPWVDVNNRSAFARATRFLLDLGHRRIGLVNGNEALDFAHRRRLGWTDALTQAGLSADPALVRSGEMTEPFGYASTQALLATQDAPTALVVSSMVMAIGVRRALAEAGLIIGRDVSVITHDDGLSYLGNTGEVPQFTSTVSHVREHGKLCAEMLLAQIDGQTLEPRLLEAQLVVGGSTGRPLAGAGAQG